MRAIGRNMQHEALPQPPCNVHPPMARKTVPDAPRRNGAAWQRAARSAQCGGDVVCGMPHVARCMLLVAGLPHP
jgi:hypothetical protein